MKTRSKFLRGVAAVAVTFLAAPSSLRAATASFHDPAGTWLTQDGNGVVRIAPCGKGLCGAIVGIRQTPGDAVPKDVAGRSQCGLPILTGSAPSTEGVIEGLITDPRDGKTYNVRLWLDGDGKPYVATSAFRFSAKHKSGVPFRDISSRDATSRDQCFRLPAKQIRPHTTKPERNSSCRQKMCSLLRPSAAHQTWLAGHSLAW